MSTLFVFCCCLACTAYLYGDASFCLINKQQNSLQYKKYDLLLCQVTCRDSAPGRIWGPSWWRPVAGGRRGGWTGRCPASLCHSRWSWAAATPPGARTTPTAWTWWGWTTSWASWCLVMWSAAKLGLKSVQLWWNLISQYFVLCSGGILYTHLQYWNCRVVIRSTQGY